MLIAHGFSKILIYRLSIFLLDKKLEVWFYIIIKRLVTSPKLLLISHEQQHFFACCLKYR